MRRSGTHLHSRLPDIENIATVILGKVGPNDSGRKRHRTIAMAYASINLFTVNTGTMNEFITLNREQFLPLLNQQNGFVAFELVQTGADSGVAILWWQSEQARIDATPRLTPWVDEHLEQFFVTLENPSGDVVLSSRIDR
jgi:hypothetical protein